ncbi:hypothetical protein E2C01_034612 [Portunus trituberculatus]|uniref:Uncharacterized protein n=1 Tax=Portunus trituberculatus TaxID=210409 RepID=A0A5B7F3A6_PORTR|nr:hypothetical protein [Portunus trituberculatus]
MTGEGRDGEPGRGRSGEGKKEERKSGAACVWTRRTLREATTSNSYGGISLSDTERASGSVSPLQRRDDDKVIELKRPINTIRARFGQKTRVANGGEVEPWGDDEDDDTTKNSIPRRNSTPGGTNREAPVTEGPSVRRHSLPHSSRSLDSSPERRLTRSTSVEVLDHKPPEIEAAACAPPPCLDITVTCEDTTLDLVEKLHKEIERNCNLLDPEPDALRGRRSRSTTPIPMDTILEDSGDKTGKNQRVAAPTSPRMEPPPEEPGESS